MKLLEILEHGLSLHTSVTMALEGEYCVGFGACWWMRLLWIVWARVCTCTTHRYTQRVNILN